VLAAQCGDMGSMCLHIYIYIYIYIYADNKSSFYSLLL